MIESAAGTGEAPSTEENHPPPWLIELKDTARRERPRDKPRGRWLGDFLDQATESGLLPTELKLLQACAQGGACTPSAPDEVSALLKGQTGDTEKAEALKKAVEPNRVRAEFLRFLALGGDEFAPVHEAGVELQNAFVDGRIDLRGAKCVERLILLNCFVDGALSIEGASLGLLRLEGSRVAGITASRAKISGAVLLQNGFGSEGQVNFDGAEIGGNLQCSGAKIGSKIWQGGLICTGAKIGGNVLLNEGFECEGSVFFNLARIGGNVDFSRASITIENGQAINAENAKVEGSFFGFGFVAKGEVSLYGTEISKDLDFRSSAIENSDNVALNCSSIRVKGLVMLGHWDRCRFEAFGMVNFYGAEIGGNFECLVDGLSIRKAWRSRAIAFQNSAMRLDK